MWFVTSALRAAINLLIVLALVACERRKKSFAIILAHTEFVPPVAWVQTHTWFLIDCYLVIATSSQKVYLLAYRSKENHRYKKLVSVPFEGS